MTITAGLAISSLYVALLGLLFIPFTMRVGLYRIANKILIGDGDDAKLLKLIRAQANFVETVPIAIVLLVLMELGGASSTWLHALGATLVIARIAHYLCMSGLVRMLPLRTGGMIGTFAVYLLAAGWLLLNVA